MPEGGGGLDGLLQPFPVLHVAGVVADAAVEDVLQGVLAQELVAQDAHALGMLEIYPKLAQVGDGVDGFLLAGELVEQVLVLNAAAGEDVLKILLLFLDVSDDSFSIVLRYVFGLVLDHCAHVLARAVLLVFLGFQAAFACCFQFTLLGLRIGF